MNNSNDEIDFLEILSILKSKLVHIITITVVVGLLSALFVWVMRDQVKIDYSLSINKESPGLIVDCGNSFSCKAKLIFSEINSDISGLSMKVNDKENIVTFSWGGDIQDSQLSRDKINTLSQNVSDWIVNDYKRYNQLLVEESKGASINSDLYSRVLLMTKNGLSKNDKLVTVTESVNQKYKSLIIVLSLILSFIAASTYFLVREKFNFDIFPSSNKA